MSAMTSASAHPGAFPKLRVLDLFSGIGGFSLGLERTGGFETVAFCEIEPKAVARLRVRYPGVTIYDDVRSLTKDSLPGGVDVVCGGFPCQDISTDGTRAGLAGERSGLWFEMARIIGEFRPTFVIVENVAELLANGFDAVLSSLAALGYNAEWDSIPASAIGAPHPRDRVWIIAYPKEKPGLHEFDAWKTAKRLLDHPTPWQAHPWNEADAAVCRVDDGFPDRVDRTELLGNAVLPQIPELIGRAILWSRAA